jgi:hypothetical protein
MLSVPFGDGGNPSPSGLVLTQILCAELKADAGSSTSLVNVANHARGSANRDRRLPCAPRTRLSPPPRARTAPLSSDERIRLVPGSRFLRALAPLQRSPAYPGLCGRECEAAIVARPQSPEGPIKPIVLAHSVIAAAPWRILFSEPCDILPPPSAPGITRCALRP